MKDEALAPVIAIMLLLAIIVTFYSLWNALVIPSMKQSSEVEHLQGVESAFQHFSSDIEKAVSLRQDRLVFSEPVQLGGGDIQFDAVRSSGSLYVKNESEPAYTLTLYRLDDTGTVTILERKNGTLANVSYEPQNNYWQDQGYRWQYGYLNITKYQTRQTPLHYYNMTDVMHETGDIGNSSLAIFAQSFGSVDYSLNRTPLRNGTINSDNSITYSTASYNCTSLDLFAVEITASPDRYFVSSNGMGTLGLISKVTRTPYYSVSAISLNGSNTDPATNAFRNAILYGWNATLSDLSDNACNNSIIFDGWSSDGFSYHIDQSASPVNVSLNTISLEVSVY